MTRHIALGSVALGALLFGAAAGAQSARPQPLGGALTPPSQADLLVSDVRFTSDGKVQVTVRNGGLTPVTSPVKVALALNDITVGQSTQNGLPATTSAPLSDRKSTRLN